MNTLTASELIELCERSFLPQEKWNNRDSCAAQMNVGTLYALLKANCQFEVDASDNDFIFVTVYAHDFSWFEGRKEKEIGNELDSRFYLPKPHRITGNDWN